MVRRFMHFEVLCIAKYRYGENFLHRKIKFYLRTGNPPSAYKQLSSKSSRTGQKSPGWAEEICLHQGHLKTFLDRYLDF
jgi:hypothetical protein